MKVITDEIGRRIYPAWIVKFYRVSTVYKGLTEAPHDTAVNRWEWRWKIRHSKNSRIIGASTEGYRKRGDCIKNFECITGIRIQPSTVRASGALGSIQVICNRIAT